MTKHLISILTLLVVSIIAMMSLIYETREAGHLTTFGYVAVFLTGISFILGIAAELYAIREKAREKAEEHAKHFEQKGQLGRIETEIKANTRPLLPVAVFYTLRHSTTSEAIERAFSGVSGFKSIKSDLLQLVGSTRLGGLGYNSIELTAEESHCVLEEGERLSSLIESHSGFGESVIRPPMSTTLEFFIPVDGAIPAQPTLVLKKTFANGPYEVKRLELFDNVVFQDCFVKKWHAQTGADQNWSVANLSNARIRFSLILTGELGPASLHNLQLFFGPISSMHGIHFPAELLSRAEFKKDPSPLFKPSNALAAQFFTSYILEFECNLTESVMSDNFVKVVAQ